MYMFLLSFVFSISLAFADSSLSQAKKIINKDCDKSMTRVIISTINENQMIFSCKTVHISVLFSMKDMQTDFVDRKSNKSFLSMTNVNADKETPLDELQKVYALSKEHDEMQSVKRFEKMKPSEASKTLKAFTEKP